MREGFRHRGRTIGIRELERQAQLRWGWRRAERCQTKRVRRRRRHPFLLPFGVPSNGRRIQTERPAIGHCWSRMKWGEDRYGKKQVRNVSDNFLLFRIQNNFFLRKQFHFNVHSSGRVEEHGRESFLVDSSKYAFVEPSFRFISFHSLSWNFYLVICGQM